MKCLILLLLLCCFTLTVKAQITLTNPKPVILVFNYPTNLLSSVGSFCVHTNGTLNNGTLGWNTMTNIMPTSLINSIIVGTNNIWGCTTVMIPGQCFFYVTMSNYWGESGPSNITNTPMAPVSIDSLQIQ